MGRAYIRITPALLLEMFPFPATAEILGSSDCVGDIEILVDDPALPDVAEGCKPPLVTPSFRRNAPIEFLDWGITWTEYPGRNVIGDTPDTISRFKTIRGYTKKENGTEHALEAVVDRNDPYAESETRKRIQQELESTNE